MTTEVERLRQDHAVLRAKLQLLNSALHAGPTAAFAVRELVYALGRRLAEHEAREDAALYPLLQETMVGDIQHHAAAIRIEHEAIEYYLRALHLLTLRGTRMPFEKVAGLAYSLTKLLRHHFAREEAILFPMLDQLNAAAGGPETRRTAPSNQEVGVNADMTVNRILGLFPQTKSVFDCHCVDCRREGDDFLDEVAWRHAVSVPDLLRELQDAAGRPAVNSEQEPFVFG